MSRSRLLGDVAADAPGLGENDGPERPPTVGQGCLLVEQAFRRDEVVEDRRRTWFHQQGQTTNTYILLTVGVFWGLAGYQFQQQKVLFFKTVWEEAQHQKGCECSQRFGRCFCPLT